MINEVELIKTIKNNQEIFLWPGDAPGTKGVNPVMKEPISAIVRPSLTSFVPEKSNGSSVIIAPGGSYEKVVFDKEGVKIAEWFNALGITAFVLKYRLPNEGHKMGHHVPLQDAQRAVRLIRGHSNEWGLDKNKIGIAGFSSGGHIAAAAATNFNKNIYDLTDDFDQENARPDFIILAYPVVARTDITPEHSIYNTPKYQLYLDYVTYEQVTSETSKSFIVLGHDDTRVSPENAVKFYFASLDAGVESELHVFRHARHGFALLDSDLEGNPIGLWPQLCINWLKGLEIIN